MNDDQEKKDECSMNSTDAEGNPNLCCCYTVDEEGRYDDPCYLPVDACC